MSIEYAIEKKGTYLLIHAEGAAERGDELVGYLEKVMDDVGRLEGERLLFDHRALSFPNERAGAYGIAVRAIKRLEPYSFLKIALLVRPERMELARIYETIALTVGASIKAFERQTMAVVWLTS